MTITLLKSKLHRARVTGGSVHYEGSLTIDRELLDAVGMLPYERILVGNMYNGKRFETYAIPGERGKREIVLNGATALLGEVGDPLTIMSFGQFTPQEAAAHAPRTATLDEQNGILRRSP